MKYVVAAVVCTMIGAAILELNADEPDGIMGNIYDSNADPDTLVSDDSLRFQNLDGEEEYYYGISSNTPPPWHYRGANVENPDEVDVLIPYGWFKWYGWKGSLQSPEYGPVHYYEEDLYHPQTMYLE